MIELTRDERSSECNFVDSIFTHERVQLEIALSTNNIVTANAFVLTKNLYARRERVNVIIDSMAKMTIDVGHSNVCAKHLRLFVRTGNAESHVVININLTTQLHRYRWAENFPRNLKILVELSTIWKR